MSVNPADIIAVLRIAALIAAALQLLAATLLWGVLWRHLFQPWLELVARAGVILPPALRASSTWRLITLAFAAPAIALWWILGTTAFREALDASAPPGP